MFALERDVARGKEVGHEAEIEVIDQAGEERRNPSTESIAGVLAHQTPQALLVARGAEVEKEGDREAMRGTESRNVPEAEVQKGRRGPLTRKQIPNNRSQGSIRHVKPLIQ